MLLSSEVYSNGLMPLGHGFPLWRPKPMNMMGRRGVQVGDLGYVTRDGGFVFLFNIHRDKDDPSQSRGAPDGFSPLQDMGEVAEETEHFVPGTRLVYPVQVQAEAAQNTGDPLHGVSLAVPKGATSTDLTFTEDLPMYLSRHAIRYYHFANVKLSCDVSNGSLYLITGFDKASTWQISLGGNFEATVLRKGELRTVKASYPVQLNRESSETPDEAAAEQCIFLRGFRISLSDQLFSRIGLRVPLDDVLSETRGFRLSLLLKKLKQTLISFVSSSKSEPYHPLKDINDKLIRANNIPIAVTHDDVWRSILLQLEGRLPTVKELYNKVLSTQQPIIRNNALFLHPKKR
ncbi:hypothetical protein C8J56DRAFT_26549 [Mycena floridula]|nr:hypothetical protein C8J56DRAFT_26549 [Mycena floridula]